jgi:hypothetical protein
MGDLKVDMVDIPKVVLFIAACGSLFGLGLFLFRDQIFSQTGDDSEDRKHTGSAGEARKTNNLASNHKTAVRFSSRDRVAEASAIELM